MLQLHIARVDECVCVCACVYVYVCVYEQRMECVIPSLGARVDMRVAVWRYHF